jgi:NADH-quinone oxidoreductase subunit E
MVFGACHPSSDRPVMIFRTTTKHRISTTRVLVSLLRRAMLSQSTRDAIAKEVASYPHKKTALLPSLKLAQKERGWLSKETLAEVADLVGVPHSNAVEIASFYAMLFTEPVAPVRVEYCIQLPCALAGAEQALQKTADKLGVTLEGKFGTRHGHTKDHKIELHGTVECYGGCHRAPMCRVGDDYVENLKTDADLDKLVSSLKQRAINAGNTNH